MQVTKILSEFQEQCARSGVRLRMPAQYLTHTPLSHPDQVGFDGQANNPNQQAALLSNGLLQ